jgi:hypothetical protein
MMRSLCVLVLLAGCADGAGTYYYSPAPASYYHPMFSHHTSVEFAGPSMDGLRAIPPLDYPLMTPRQPSLPVPTQYKMMAPNIFGNPY